MNGPDGILDLFKSNSYLKICAPMVRYSKLQFRQLVRLYDCDLAFTPMILADSFVLSNKARKNEFTTSRCDQPLIVQFAASNITDFVGAATLISPFCNGVDLNCGCPQRWAKKLGLGCELMNKPEDICNILKECKSAIKKKNFTISVKIRIMYDLKKTIDLCQKLDKAGVSFISVHGRTADQSTGPVNKEAIKLICQNVSCPVVANGGIETLIDCENMYQDTNCNGVMVGNGILTNPALFTGKELTTQFAQLLVEQWIKICCVNSWVENSVLNILHLNKPNNITFQCFHHHLVFMLSKILNRSQKQIFNNLKNFHDVMIYINTNNLIPNPPLISLDNKLFSDDYKELSLIYDTDNKYVHTKNILFQKETDLNGDKGATGKYFNEFTLNDLFV